ncbi:MAG: magnesium transporter [Clostridiales bacterium]|nr:magnesium transporter [Clostridiales bacterium]
MQLLEQRDYQKLRSILSDMYAADIAAVLEELPENKLPIVFRILPKELASETFAYFDTDIQEVLIRAFSDTELEEVINQLYLDDTVDMIEEMPANIVRRILDHTTPEMRLEINQILKYPKDSAGSIMTTEYVALKPDMTVSEAFTRIRRTAIDKETVYTCYVIANDRTLIGVVTVKDLLMHEYENQIKDIMETNVIFVNTHEDKEIVAKAFERYDFLALPVVDRENRLVGIVTIDDAVDVLQDEATEDIEMMAAITPTDKPYLKTGVFETWRKRIPWLLLLMISATFTGSIIQHYEDALGKYIILSSFIPMLMDTGGNAGGQSSVTIIRGLSLGEIEMRDILRIIWKEMRVAVMCGLTLSVTVFFKILFIDRPPEQPITIALIVSGTMALAVVVAKIVGCSLPVLAKRIGFDPAVMASPFITTIVDAVSLMIYFGIVSNVMAL